MGRRLDPQGRRFRCREIVDGQRCKYTPEDLYEVTGRHMEKDHGIPKEELPHYKDVYPLEYVGLEVDDLKPRITLVSPKEGEQLHTEFKKEKAKKKSLEKQKEKAKKKREKAEKKKEKAEKKRLEKKKKEKAEKKKKKEKAEKKRLEKNRGRKQSGTGRPTNARKQSIKNTADGEDPDMNDFSDDATIDDPDQAPDMNDFSDDATIDDPDQLANTTGETELSPEQWPSEEQVEMVAAAEILMGMRHKDDQIRGRQEAEATAEYSYKGV